MQNKVRIIYAADAVKDLKRFDKPVARRIVLKIEANAEEGDPLARAKMLTGALGGYYRYRVGDYRIIFAFNKTGTLSVLKVLCIKHRKGVYQ